VTGTPPHRLLADAAVQTGLPRPIAVQDLGGDLDVRVGDPHRLLMVLVIHDLIILSFLLLEQDFKFGFIGAINPNLKVRSKSEK
jgi:hypothetical protein